MAEIAGQYVPARIGDRPCDLVLHRNADPGWPFGGGVPIGRAVFADEWCQSRCWCL